jgi:hypothetical protein
VHISWRAVHVLIQMKNPQEILSSSGNLSDALPVSRRFPARCNQTNSRVMPFICLARRVAHILPSQTALFRTRTALGRLLPPLVPETLSTIYALEASPNDLISPALIHYGSGRFELIDEAAELDPQQRRLMSTDVLLQHVRVQFQRRANQIHYRPACVAFERLGPHPDHGHTQTFHLK